MKTNGKPINRKKPKVIGVSLYPGDLTGLKKIKDEHGLLHDTEAIRLAIRETVRSITIKESQAA
jgi:hypothetical protein